MNINIRHWLAEHYIEIHQLQGFSPGKIAGVAFRIVEDMEVKSLMPLDICTLAEVLELPLGAIECEIIAIAQLTIAIVRALSEKKPLKRNEGTWLAFQIAYLQALAEVINQEKNLQRPWLDRAIIWNAGSKKIGTAETEFLPRLLQDARLLSILKTFRPGKLTDTQAEQALSLVADSLLVQQMNNAGVAWFVANGAEEEQAKLFTQRLLNAIPGHLLMVIAQNAAPLAQLQKFVRLGNLNYNLSPQDAQGVENSRLGDKIDLQREEYRASLIQELSQPLFMESFSLKDIYVPLKGLPIEESDLDEGKKNHREIDLMTWAQQQLTDLESIAVIESEPGYGKSSFCQIWAAEVAREHYPTWMPVIIRLRDVTIGKTAIETLNSAFSANFSSYLATWLNQKNFHCLLLLDGLDELPATEQGKITKSIFIQDLLKFQYKYGHKIVLTTKANTLEEIAKQLPLKLRRIAIQPLGVDELREWFKLWTQIQSLPIAQNFFTFLKQAGLFATKSNLPKLSVLVRQPLMLYLLGILHRDALLDDDILHLAASEEHTTSAPILWEVYCRLSRWLLGYPIVGGMRTMLLRPGCAHIHRTQEAIANSLSGRNPQDLLQIVQTTALKILHGNGYYVHLSRVTVPALYFQTQELENSPSLIKIEFSHPKIGEFLCAEVITAQLIALTQRQENNYSEFSFVVESPVDVAQQIYHLLGYGIFSQEIEELVIEGLRRKQNSEFSFDVLCDRLLSFWRAYCRGIWLDEGIAHTAKTYFQTLQNPISVEQINAAVGLNVFLLLCACYRQIKLSFSPCGNPASLAQFYPEAVLMLIAKTAVLDKNAFYHRIYRKTLAGLNLSGASLPQVMLNKVNLEQTNLSDADLMGANLVGANLIGANLADANLTSANLTGANLADANLTGANLTGANFTGVNLTSVNLTNACLFDAILADTEREVVALKGGMFSLEQFKTLKCRLSQSSYLNAASSTNANTDRWVNNTAQMGLIESVEGEPMSAIDLYDNYGENYPNEETVFSPDAN